MASPVVIPLAPKWEQAWKLSVSAIQFAQPAFTHLLYSLMNKTGDRHVYWFTGDLPTLATDGARVYANPEYYFGLELAEQVFASCHEILHAACRHPQQMHWHLVNKAPVLWGGKSLPFDLDTCNIAMDYWNNAFLIEGAVGKFKDGWYYNTAIATSKTPWQQAYHLIYEAVQEQKKGNGTGPSITDGSGAPMPGPGAMVDEHLPPGTSDGTTADAATNDAEDMEWKMAVQAAVLIGEKAGRLPASLAVLFEEMLQPSVSWNEHVEGFLARRVASGGYDYHRSDRRLRQHGIYVPARSGRGCNVLVVACDSSSSILASKGTIERIFGELRGTVDMLKPRLIHVVWCDTKVQRVDEVRDLGDLEVVYNLGGKGGGGTSFVPVFRWIEKEGIEPDALIYLTDLEGAFPPNPPGFPVVWGNVGRASAKAPFGEVVVIPR